MTEHSETTERPAAAPSAAANGGSRSLRTDPRADPRMIAALAAFQLDGPAAAPPLDWTAERAELLEFLSATEGGFEGLLGAFVDGLPPVAGVESSTTTIAGPGGDLRLHISRPRGIPGPLPCVYHIHGGGMVIMRAGHGFYVRWREELAAAGVVVVGVEFRNGAGALGAHPYPAGSDDCAAGLRWVAAHRDELGVAQIIVNGDSGGGGLALAVALRAAAEGWASAIAGVYAQCPVVLGIRDGESPRYPSLTENEGYFLHEGLFAIMNEAYDPGRRHQADPLCWPGRATDDELAGLPPHLISVNELDPLRDAALEYYRRLVRAGVPAVAVTNHGVCHDADLMFRSAMPDFYAASVAAVAGFAKSAG
ncbi:alpha/beta hydrolase fold domain-containing protein [Nocardia harenae]|uniref:alpha/beta hydrolase fold domain-containing protein n=1 Tax=Nocardia harenae TaxID=358707 RepID=UPI000A9BCB8C|nr:alpha/beta hydrolase fold domain-containing protein [Nocardia harenae]